MDDFTPESLSPRSIPLRECPLPYGLTWDDVSPSLSGFDSGRAAHAQSFLSHAKSGPNVARGKGANSCIVTLRYPTVDGGTQDTTVFVKQQVELPRFEAPRYRFLQSRGVPSPLIVAAVERAGVEVVVLEFLPKIGVDFGSRSEVDDLLKLVARWNAADTAPPGFQSPDGIPESVFNAAVKAGMVRVANHPSVSFPIDVDTWFDVYLMVCETARDQPRALIHGEFYVQQVGWSQRNGGQELVVFDLESMALRSPRLSDIAGLLRPLARESARDEVELFDVYLNTLRSLTAVSLHLDEAFRELRYVRVMQGCWALRHIDDPSLPSARSTLNILHDDLDALGLVPPSTSSSR